jgi:hypothetical protein
VRFFLEGNLSKVDQYRAALQSLEDWIPYLLAHSGLPGPRGNLELAHAAAQAGDRRRYETFLRAGADAAENTPEVFLVFCGILGLGRLAARSGPGLFNRLRQFASDPRWRVREAVATGLQLAGDADMARLLKEMQSWSRGTPLEQRAAAAALAEPRLLQEPAHARAALKILDAITTTMQAAKVRDEAFRTLRQGMGYCWSVAVAALPPAGKPLMEKWLRSKDADVRWMMKENLKKNRLVKMDEYWVKKCLARL